jgi:hypothetical protein
MRITSEIARELTEVMRQERNYFKLGDKGKAKKIVFLCRKRLLT